MGFFRIVAFSTTALSALLCSSSMADEAAAPRPIDKVLATQQPAAGTTDKIVGGAPAEPGKYPFQVALIASNTPEGREHFGQFCGGSLINADWVLTAAHCVPQTRAEEVDVYLGATVLPAGEGPGTGSLGVRRQLVQIVSHQDYDPNTHDNDVALLKLKDPAPANLQPSTVATAELAKEFGEPGTSVTVIGWGATEEGGNTTPTLMAVDVTVQESNLCQQNYQAVAPGIHVTGNMFCAGLPEGKKDSCQGDSGGPIGAAAADDKFVQLGVVSWGIGCARPELFGVYTRLSNYEPWVREVMSNF